ncbi:hypothetical protein D3C81_1689940 [compost metagenome]
MMYTMTYSNEMIEKLPPVKYIPPSNIKNPIIKLTAWDNKRDIGSISEGNTVFLMRLELSNTTEVERLRVSEK